MEYTENLKNLIQKKFNQTGSELLSRLELLKKEGKNELKEIDEFVTQLTENDYSSVGLTVESAPYNFRKFISLKDDFSILDIGCGFGRDCFQLQKCVGENGIVIGIDTSEKLIELSNILKVHKNLKNIEFLIANMENLPFPDQKFDLVLANYSIRYSVNKEQTINEIFRVLKPNGFLCFSDVVMEGSISREIYECLDTEFGNAPDCPSIVDYLSILEKSGFKNLRVRTKDPIPFHHKKSLGLHTLEKIKKLQEKELGPHFATFTASKNLQLNTFTFNLQR